MTDKDAATRKAIEVMTAWTTAQDSNEFASSLAAEHLVGPDDGAEFVGGLLSLCGDLLLRVAKAEGESGNATPEEQCAVLQDIAQRTLGP